MDRNSLTTHTRQAKAAEPTGYARPRSPIAAMTSTRRRKYLPSWMRSASGRFIRYIGSADVEGTIAYMAPERFESYIAPKATYIRSV